MVLSLNKPCSLCSGCCQSRRQEALVNLAQGQKFHASFGIATVQERQTLAAVLTLLEAASRSNVNAITGDGSYQGKTALLNKPYVKPPAAQPVQLMTLHVHRVQPGSALQTRMPFSA
jgi:hypothetical protein